MTIAILLATYNGAKFVGEQIDSILNQSNHDWHLFVRDDGSCDDTVNILDQYAAKHPGKITVVKDEKGNLGHIKNFSRLMEIAKADKSVDYVMFCDQDDVWYPHKVEKTLATMKEQEKRHGTHDPIIVHSEVRLTHENGEDLGQNMRKNQRRKPPTLKHELIQVNMWGCTQMMNRSLLELATPIPDNMIGHDAWVGILGIAAGHHGYIDEPTMAYRRHDNNTGGPLHNITMEHRVRTTRAHLPPYVEQANAAKSRITERLGEDRVPPEMHRFLELAESSPQFLAPARLIADGYEAAKWTKNAGIIASGFLRSNGNGRQH